MEKERLVVRDRGINPSFIWMRVASKGQIGRDIIDAAS